VNSTEVAGASETTAPATSASPSASAIATAAAKACLVSIIKNHKTDSIEVKLPKEKKILIPIANCDFGYDKSRCSVIKDGGDDPDVTHGAEIIVELGLTDRVGEIEIDGGEGVGRVTKPGLGLEIGSAAINPTPRRMIIENLREVGEQILQKNGIKIVISVPKGSQIAPKTDNPRLGIIGGISILGTSGIVVPYSTASFAAAIRQCLDVNVAMGDQTVVLTTGARSEDFAKKEINLPDHCFVQMGDFSGYTIQQCSKKPINFILDYYLLYMSCSICFFYFIYYIFTCITLSCNFCQKLHIYFRTFDMCLFDSHSNLG